MSVQCTAYMPKIEEKASHLNGSSSFSSSFSFCKGSWERTAQTQTSKLELHKVMSLGSYCWKPIPKEQPAPRSWLWSLHPNVLRFFHPWSEVKLKPQLSSHHLLSWEHWERLDMGNRRTSPLAETQGTLPIWGSWRTFSCIVVCYWGEPAWGHSEKRQSLAKRLPHLMVWMISSHVVPLEVHRAQQLACFWGVWEVHAQAAEDRLITAWARVLTG